MYSKGKKSEKLNFFMRDREAAEFTRDREAVNIHANPVIRGLVKHPRDWRWSSWGFYYGGGTGLVRIDAD